MAAEDIKKKIEAANEEAVKRLNAGDPVLVDIAPAGEVIPGFQDRMITHSGPPIDWSRMCGAQRGAMIGAVLFEGWAKSPEEASHLLEGGRSALSPIITIRPWGPRPARSPLLCPFGSWRTRRLETGRFAAR